MRFWASPTSTPVACHRPMVEAADGAGCTGVLLQEAIDAASSSGSRMARASAGS